MRGHGVPAWAVLLGASVLGLGGGAALHLAGATGAADGAWIATTVLGVGPAIWWVVEAARARRLGADVIAVLALVGTLAAGEHLAGAIIAVMLATGRALEARAARRAEADLRALAARMPRTARRHGVDGLETVDVSLIAPGDLLAVGAGEVVPVDGRVEGSAAVLDESTLTGEPLPVTRRRGEDVASGAANAGAAFDLRATTDAAGSTYAAIVRLVESAQVSSAPFVRLADRYAGAFLVVSLAVAGLAWWWSGDAVRAVAVLVVATPCPLILAAPIALVSGLSRTARRGVVVKGGSALERLAQMDVLLLDKTGTVTSGRPTVATVAPATGWSGEDVLALAASLDQVSPHVVAAALVRAALERGAELSVPSGVHEEPGRGVRGRVGDRSVAVGGAEWVGAAGHDPWVRGVRRRAEIAGSPVVFVAVDGQVAGAIVLDDPIRPDAARTVRQLRDLGLARIVMVTGDRADIAHGVGAALGVDEVLAERTAVEKVDAVRAERDRPGSEVVGMIGDGVNDAAALALADLGIAIGARGATVSAEAADVVLVVDRLDRVSEAIAVAQRTRAIARQSVLVGIGLSLLAMAAAAVGTLPPAAGALVQEVIDVAAILNALRALGGGPRPARLEGDDAALARRFSEEHHHLGVAIERLREIADALGQGTRDEAASLAAEAERLLAEEIEPHERAEDAELYPALAKVLGGPDPMGAMSRAHAEISHLGRRIRSILALAGPAGPDDEDVAELRRVLYGLHAILVLHMAQEEEGYLSLVDEPPAPPVDTAAGVGSA